MQEQDSPQPTEDFYLEDAACHIQEWIDRRMRGGQATDQMLRGPSKPAYDLAATILDSFRGRLAYDAERASQEEAG